MLFPSREGYCGKMLRPENRNLISIVFRRLVQPSSPRNQLLLLSGRQIIIILTYISDFQPLSKYSETSFCILGLKLALWWYSLIRILFLCLHHGCNDVVTPLPSLKIPFKSFRVFNKFYFATKSCQNLLTTFQSQVRPKYILYSHDDLISRPLLLCLIYPGSLIPLSWPLDIHPNIDKTNRTSYD